MTASSSKANDGVPEVLMEKLRATARARTVTYYSEIAPLLGIDIGDEHFAARVGQVLDAVNRREFEAKRPLLSAVVVSKDTHRPGYGFVVGARQLKRLEGKTDDEAWLNELMAVYECWSLQ